MTDLLQQEIIRRAESMKLFERDGHIHFGTWRRWWNASPEEADKILKQFREQENDNANHRN